MVTRDEALALLEKAGIENGDTATPLDRAEITRRLMEAVNSALGMPADQLTWQAPIPNDEDNWEWLDDHIQPDFGTALVWPESLPETFGGLVLVVERQFSHLWKQTVTDCETNPKRCGTQAAFYGVRNILRALYVDDTARWRPSTPVADVLPLDKREKFERRIGEEYGISLPTELKVFGKLSFLSAWWTLWLAAITAIVLLQPPGGWSLVGIIVVVTVVITIGLMWLTQNVWSDSLQTLGDIARHISTEQVKLRNQLKEAAETPSAD